MKYTLLVACMFTAFAPAYAQVLTQDATGTSTILFNGQTFGFNIQSAAIDFSFNNFANARRQEKDKRLVWGGSLSGKNKEGIGAIFDGRMFVPEAKGNVLFGWTQTFDESEEVKNLEENISAKKKKSNDEKDAYFQKTLPQLIADFLLILPKEVSSLAVKADLEDIVKTKPLAAIRMHVEHLSLKYPKAEQELTLFAKVIGTSAETFDMQQEAQEREITTVESDLDKHRTYWNRRLTVYGTAGGGGTSFKRFTGTNFANIEDGFKKETFSSFDVAATANYEMHGEWIFGLGFGYRRANNFPLLDDKTYTIRTTETDSSGRQQIIEDKFTGYDGDYKTFNQYYINVDVLRWFPLTENGMLALTLYWRHQISDSYKAYPNVSNIGISAFGFKKTGNFIGGAYLEIADTNNNIEKTKKEPKLKPAYQRVAFGLVTRFALGTTLKQ